MEKVILCIIDGFALESKNKSAINPLKLTSIPNINSIFSKYPTISIDASGSYVGLPEEQMGNSEVGHLTIGSGRIPEQSLKMIQNKIIEDNLISAYDLERINNSNAVHIFGLFSKGGIHSHESHFYKTIEKIAKNKEIFLHLFTDGRDSDIKEGLNSIKNLEFFIKKFPNVKIATVCGRFYAMDRDSNLDRTEIAFNNITNPNFYFSTAEDGILHNYNNNITDEFIKPFTIKESFKNIKENDSLLFLNFRTDRMRQIVSAFCDPNSKFYKKIFDKINCYTMTNYFSDSEEKWQQKINIILKQNPIKNTLSEIISDNNLTQVKITETEKYAHLTFFINGLREKSFKNEERIMIKSPNVKTYDLKPEMSIFEVEKTVREKIKEKKDVIFINIPNCDMIGHTGNLEAAIKTLEYVDNFVGTLTNEALANNYNLIITSDHGNIESMNLNNKIHTSHTDSKVPFCIISNKKYKLKKNGSLANIAPTILDILRIKKPKEMKESLIEEN